MVADAPNPGAHAGVAQEAPTNVSWANGALVLAGVVAIVAKIAGVVVEPGLRGLAAQGVIDGAETVSAALAYTLSAFLVALVCGGSFELARVRRLGLFARATVVGLSGLVVALASPAVVTRLHVLAALLLAVVTSLIALVAGLTAARASHTRIVGAVIALYALSGLLRPVAWEANAFAIDRPSVLLDTFALAAASTAIVVQALATLLAAAWLGTRALWRGRILANVAMALAFGATWLAVREHPDAPGMIESVLRGSIGHASGLPVPAAFATIQAFLVPASTLLAAVTLVQRPQPATVLVPLALALLSSGAFDVPLQALAIVAAGQWAMLAVADDRALWSSLTARRSS